VGGDERDGRRQFERPVKQFDIAADDVPLAAHPLNIDRNQLSPLDQLLSQRVAAGEPRIPRIRVRRAEKLEDALAVSTRTNQPVRAIARQHLVAQLLVQREVMCKHLGGKEPLGQVVLAVIALPLGNA
jgi:hypothetical protein